MEIAVYTGPTIEHGHDTLKNGQPYHWVFRQPKGSVVVALTSTRIRKKWVEIVCSLMSPKLRDKYSAFDAREPLIAAWKPEFADVYRAVQKDKMSVPDAWEAIKNDLPDIGTDPTGEVSRYDCWNWSECERREFLLMPVEDDDLFAAKTIKYMRNGLETVGFPRVFDYPTRSRALSLRHGIEEIENPAIRIDPDFGNKIRCHHLERTCNTLDLLPLYEED